MPKYGHEKSKFWSIKIYIASLHFSQLNCKQPIASIYQAEVRHLPHA